jgi:hypothetical protein
MSRNTKWTYTQAPHLFEIGNSADYVDLPVATNRGWERVWKVEGTAAVTGTAVVGTSSNFTKILSVGSRVYISGQVRTVASIANDTHMTINSALASNVTGVTIYKLVEVVAAVSEIAAKEADVVVVPTFTLAVPADGNYTSGQTLEFIVTPSEAVEVYGKPTISLGFTSGTEYAAYVPALSTPTSLVFEYVVKSTDQDYNGISVSNVIALNGGEIDDVIVTSGAYPIPSAALTFTVPATTGILVND